jgi:hypothetical protein
MAAEQTPEQIAFMQYMQERESMAAELETLRAALAAQDAPATTEPCCTAPAVAASTSGRCCSWPGCLHRRLSSHSSSVCNSVPADCCLCQLPQIVLTKGFMIATVFAIRSARVLKPPAVATAGWAAHATYSSGSLHLIL